MPRVNDGVSLFSGAKTVICALNPMSFSVISFLKPLTTDIASSMMMMARATPA